MEYDTALASVAKDINIKIQRQRCFIHLLMDVTDEVYKANREEDLEGTARLLTFMLFQTDQNMKALGKNREDVKKLNARKTQHAIVELLLPTICRPYVADNTAGRHTYLPDEQHGGGTLVDEFGTVKEQIQDQGRTAEYIVHVH